MFGFIGNSAISARFLDNVLPHGQRYSKNAPQLNQEFLLRPGGHGWPVRREFRSALGLVAEPPGAEGHAVVLHHKHPPVSRPGGGLASDLEGHPVAPHGGSEFLRADEGGPHERCRPALSMNLICPPLSGRQQPLPLVLWTLATSVGRSSYMTYGIPGLTRTSQRARRGGNRPPRRSVPRRARGSGRREPGCSASTYV